MSTEVNSGKTGWVAAATLPAFLVLDFEAALDFDKVGFFTFAIFFFAVVFLTDFLISLFFSILATFLTTGLATSCF